MANRPSSLIYGIGYFRPFSRVCAWIHDTEAKLGIKNGHSSQVGRQKIGPIGGATTNARGDF